MEQRVFTTTLGVEIGRAHGFQKELDCFVQDLNKNGWRVFSISSYSNLSSEHYLAVHYVFLCEKIEKS